MRKEPIQRVNRQNKTENRNNKALNQEIAGSINTRMELKAYGLGKKANVRNCGKRSYCVDVCRGRYFKPEKEQKN